MYYIVNRRKSKIAFGDLNFVLGPKKAIDLDKVRSRDKINASQELKAAIRSGLIQLRRDSERKPKTVVSKIKVSYGDDIDEIKKVVREEIKSEFKDHKPASQDNEELISVLKKLTTLMNRADQPMSFAQAASDAGVVIDESDLDEETLTAIHAKHVKRVTKDTIGKVYYDEKSVEDSLADRAKELDDLIG